MNYVDDLKMYFNKKSRKFLTFFQDVKLLFGELQTRLRLLRTLAHKVAAYFCENIDDFSLQKCFQDLHAFYEAVKKCRTVSNSSNSLVLQWIWKFKLTDYSRCHQVLFSVLINWQFSEAFFVLYSDDSWVCVTISCCRNNNCISLKLLLYLLKREGRTHKLM